VKTLGSKENKSSDNRPAVSRTPGNSEKSHPHSVRHTAGIVEITALLIALEERVLCLQSIQQAAEEIRALRDFISTNQKNYPKCFEIIPYYSLVKKLLRFRGSSGIQPGRTPVMKEAEKEGVKSNGEK